MDDEAAFLQTIHAAPADDAPRLVYADWLDEHGDPTGPSSSASRCELARPRTAPGPATAAGRPHRELLDAHRRRWLGGLAGSPVPWVFRRGFVERLGAGGFFRRRVDYKGDVNWERLRFFPDGRLLQDIYECPHAAPGWRPWPGGCGRGNRHLWRGVYSLHAGPDGTGGHRVHAPGRPPQGGAAGAVPGDDPGGRPAWSRSAYPGAPRPRRPWKNTAGSSCLKVAEAGSAKTIVAPATPVRRKVRCTGSKDGLRRVIKWHEIATRATWPSPS